MTRYYKRPILLIEFEEGKPFSLQVRTRKVLIGDPLRGKGLGERESWKMHEGECER